MIALINPARPSDTSTRLNEPISLMYLASSLKKAGIDGDIYDLTLYKTDNENVVLSGIASKYKYFGVTSYYSLEPLDIAQKLKIMNSKCIIIAGGPMATIKAKEYLCSKLIDYVIMGEGEDIIVDLLLSLEKKSVPSNVKGLAFIKDGVFYSSGFRKPIQNLDDLSFPRRNDETFFNYTPTIISSRGCDHKCSFCSASYLGPYRYRSAEDVLKEIEYLVDTFSIDYFQFVDGNFLANIDRAMKIADGIIEKKIIVKFDIACRIDTINSNWDVIMHLKDAGLYRVLIGVESFDNRTLNKWAKGITDSNIINGLRMLQDNSIGFILSLILFYPEVNIEDLYNNIEIIKTLKIMNNIEDIFNYLRFIPGTRINTSNVEKMYEYKKPYITAIRGLINKYQKYKIIIESECLLDQNEKKIYYCIFKNEKAFDFYFLEYLINKYRGDFYKEESINTIIDNIILNRIKYTENAIFAFDESRIQYKANIGYFVDVNESGSRYIINKPIIIVLLDTNNKNIHSTFNYKYSEYISGNLSCSDVVKILTKLRAIGVLEEVISDSYK